MYIFYVLIFILNINYNLNIIYIYSTGAYNKPTIHDVSFDSLLPYVNQQLGFHHIRTKLYSVSLKVLHNLFDKVKQMPSSDFSTPEYRLGAVIMDIANHRLFKPTRTEEPTPTPRLFFKLQYANKGIDAVNISNILNQKKSNPVYHHILR